MNLSKEYPAWVAFWESQKDVNRSPCAMAAMRAKRGKRKARRAEPACYGDCCGAECRRTLAALTDQIDRPGR